MPKKPTVVLRKPPPAVDPQVAERFVSTGANEGPKATTAHAPTRRRAVIVRADGRELRRTTVYLTPDLRRRIAVFAAEQDTDISAAIVEICRSFLDDRGK